MSGKTPIGTPDEVWQIANNCQSEKEKLMNIPKLVLSTSPHLHNGESIPHIMYSVILALLPATLVAIYLFGLPALKVIVVSVLSAVVTESISRKVMKRADTIADGSAAVTGLLLALTLPPTTPWWAVISGAVVAIVIGKQIYGGLGHNPFNPALVGRVALLISWPVQLTYWVKPTPLFSSLTDAVSMASPLGVLKTEGVAKLSNTSLTSCLLGNIPGSIGEVSVLALLIGAALLLWKGYITWHIPVSYIASVGVISIPFWLIQPDKYASPMFHILTGGLILGAFFMATDMVTSPITTKGMLIFGTGCGVLTMVIRLFGGYPEGVSFAILIMNAVTPLIDTYTQPLSFGRVAKRPSVK